MRHFFLNLGCVFLAAAFHLHAIAQQLDAAARSIPFDQLGAEAQKQYSGDGIRVSTAQNGAKLLAIMQDLEAEATRDGLWLTSTAGEDAGKSNRFRVKAVEASRSSAFDIRHSAFTLPSQGAVRASKDAVLWLRPGLIEQYTVSTDGVRQDFLIPQRPPGEGDQLRVDLTVTGARAETASYGAKLTVEATGRELAYNRLKVMDATGKELPAEMHVIAPHRLRVEVRDAEAVYPVRIDPTFSDADWIVVNPGLAGANGAVNAIAADGSGSLYFGGEFTFIGTAAANRIAKWDGNHWSALGSGMDNTVLTLAISGSDLYAGGFFTTAGGISASFIAKWNGSVWSPVGSGTNGGVYALVSSGTDVFAGGSFDSAGGVMASHIAKWNGSAWSALGSGTNAWVYALAVSGGDLYAGGEFGSAGGVTTGHVARWDGAAWSALGPSPGGEVHALAANGGVVYAGGNFASADGSETYYGVSRWDGSVWTNLGTFGTIDTVAGVPNVYALALNEGELYAGGIFTTMDGVSTNNIAKWNGSAWSALGSGMSGSFAITFPVKALAMRGGDLYAGGNFTTAGDMGANYIAKWNGSAWSALLQGMAHKGTGISPHVSALAVSGGDLYVGGSFTTTGGVNANHIAKWNGSAWSALGPGLNFFVNALAVSGSNLYAGGSFFTAGGVSANYIAKWNGNEWSPLGSGMSGSPYNTHVDALAVSGGDLYAAGAFTTAGGVTVNNIAKWNGSAWSALDSGMDGYVYALAANGSSLYAGGTFATAGGMAANGIARWDGSAWSPLGSGVGGTNPWVAALAVSGGDLYAGGLFTTAGGTSANFIAKWNGYAWSMPGSGMDNYVYALTVSGGDLYAGGDFSTAGGVIAHGIAKWNGGAWSALGTGIDWSVQTIVVNGGDLYAGGRFYSAGGKASPFIARANVTGGIPDSDGDGLLDSWEMAHFAFRDAHGLSDDDDHDGYNNLLEEALDLDPMSSSTGSQPPVVEDGGHLTMTITKQPGVSYEVQSAGTLQPAQPDSFSTASTTVLINDATTLKVRDNVPVGTPAGRFMRVKVTAAP